ncbi:MAG: hypothetical protein GF364_12670 [Candidatus Lokiarchaeota archaeon]|nr:hypothetical protein [Candidatus Lokiarchaeota archaeon]
MDICQFCGRESSDLQKCPLCLQYLCPDHFDPTNHDCPRQPALNPYTLGKITNESKEPSISDVTQSQENLKKFINNELSDVEIESEPTSKYAFNMGVDKTTEQVKGEGSITADDDYTEIENPIEGVYNIEHEYQDPDGYAQPIQFIKPDCDYAKKLHILPSRTKECYFCGKATDKSKGGTFISCRNVEERLLTSMRRGLFGGSTDGFWICSNPDCKIKWNSKEPVYLTFKSGKIYKYVHQWNMKAELDWD